MRLAFLRVPALLLFSALACAQLHAAADYGVDLKGTPIKQLAGPGARAVVLIFAASDCPISNRYVPEIARLDQEYASRGVRFWWVFPNPEDTSAIVSKHNQDFAIKEPALMDTQQALVRMAHATVTPEGAVFAVEGGELREVYHGRIDDRYLSIGTERPQASEHDLEAAITAILAGNSSVRPTEPAIGCAIVPVEK